MTITVDLRYINLNTGNIHIIKDIVKMYKGDSYQRGILHYRLDNNEYHQNCVHNEEDFLKIFVKYKKDQ
jgi:hypothetical protein